MDLNTSATFWHGKLFLHTFCELQLYVWFHSLYTLTEVVHIEEKGPHQASSGRLQEVKKLIMENYEIIRPKSGCSHLWELVIYRRLHSRVLTGKILPFWIGGRLWQVVVSPGGMFDCSQIKKVTKYKRISEVNFIWARKLTFLTRWLL